MLGQAAPPGLRPLPEVIASCNDAERSVPPHVAILRKSFWNIVKLIDSVLHVGALMLQMNLQPPFSKERLPGVCLTITLLCNRLRNILAESETLVFILVAPLSSMVAMSKAFPCRLEKVSESMQKLVSTVYHTP